MPNDPIRFLEIADRFTLLAAKERDQDLRRQYTQMANQLRQLASERILDVKGEAAVGGFFDLEARSLRAAPI